VWKLIVFLILCVTGLMFFACMVLAVNRISLVPALDVVRSAAFGVLMGAVAFLWLCLSVRCRACRGRVAWHVVKTADVNVWATQLMSMPACSMCGHRPGVDQVADNGRAI
jgi:hypothetical protein